MDTNTDAIQKINEEGFDENAALIIGKKEDMPRLLERILTKGFAENVATYIRLHKTVLVPENKIQGVRTDFLRKEFIGTAWITDYSEGPIIHFIDTDFNIAKVAFDRKKIASAPKNPDENFGRWLRNELEKLGFTVISDVDNVALQFNSAIMRHDSRMEAEREKKIKESFKF